MRLRILGWAVLGLLLAGCGGGGEDPGTSTPSATASPEPEAPTGTKLVGTAGVVIAIPDGWTQADGLCPYPSTAGSYAIGAPDPTADPSDSADYIDANCGYDGLDEIPTDYLRVIPGSGASFDLRGLGAVEATHGDLTYALTTACHGDVCRATWSMASPDVLFSLEVARSSGGRTAIDAMDSTLQVLPDGWTTSDTDGTVVPDE